MIPHPPTLPLPGRLRDVGDLRRLVPGLLGVTVLIGSWLSASGGLGVRSSWPEPVIAVLAGACALAAAHARVRLWPLYAVAAVAWIAVVMWPALAVASYYAGTNQRRPGQLGGYLLGAGMVMVASIPVGVAVGGDRYLNTATPANFLMMCLMHIGLPLIVGLLVDARRQTLTALRERADQLEREQQARTDRVRAEERNRIAREMHDVVAHRVSLMVLHAGALEVSATDAGTVETAALIRSTGREALANLRDVLGVLRSEWTVGAGLVPQPALADLDRLLEESRGAGVAVTRHDDGTPQPLPVTVEHAAYRVVQEALTNVHKYARDGVTDVHLRYLPDSLEVSVRNTAPTTVAEGLPGAGLGLVGLRERVELLDGRLETGGEPDGGFTVRARIPYPGRGVPA
ncbi:sensor histidine kinase [Micromonospora pisi]|uniref:sensor histidine kinase n=1 Tax=Micromonospora pisi TaxID=589240 RepID=UPI0011C462D3|nr:histidine kinase [Micromonospora pisi]